MAVAFTFRNMQWGYLDLVDALMSGRRVSPRGLATREIASPVIELTDPRKALVTGINRKLNLKLFAAEAAQLVGGFSDPAMLNRVAPNMAQFMDGGAFYGAYGPRLMSQLHEVVRQLTEDFGTRQAQLAIWQQPDLYVRTRDKPCTSLFQFLVRDDKLELHVTMRSNDIWWGVPYDIASFCCLQLTVAHWLNLEPGSYFHRPVSLHVYERDVEAVKELRAPTVKAVDLPFFKNRSWPWQPGKRVEDFVHDSQLHIRDLVYGRAEPVSTEERWFCEQLAERHHA